MFDRIAELMEKIRLGEDSHLELKEVRFVSGKVSSPNRNSLADELAAFANSRGGVLVLGVEDKTRDIVGLPWEHLDLVEEYVRQVCIDSISPILAPVIEKLQLPDTGGVPRPVIKVEISRSLFVHQSPGGYMQRIGSSKRQMPPDYLARLFQQRSQTRLIRFDEQIVADSRLTDLDPELWRRLAGPNQSGRDKDILTKLGLAAREKNDSVFPTVAGILMATRDSRKWLPNAFIQAVAYRGVTIMENGGAHYQIDAADIQGPLDRQVMEACAFVKKNMKVAASKLLGRIDRPQFDLTAVFEAVVNAVAHRGLLCLRIKDPPQNVRRPFGALFTGRSDQYHDHCQPGLPAISPERNPDQYTGQVSGGRCGTYTSQILYDGQTW